MTTASIAGGTGLVGGFILKTLLASPSYKRVHAFTRKDIPADEKLTLIKSADTASWAGSFPQDATIFYSALGTTRAQAGGLANQRKVDYDLALDLATAAKEAGVKTYVLISVALASSSSVAPYIKMKGELEDKVKELGFDHCVIVQPGLIVGGRDHLRLSEAFLQTIARAAGAVTSGLKDFWAQDAEVIGRAAVAAGSQDLSGATTPKVTIVSQADIIRLGRTEWKSV